MKKQLLLFVLMLLPMVASAEKVEIDGIFYYLNSMAKTAKVTYGNWEPYPYQNGDGRYTGAVIIPESVTYENMSYSVTTIDEGAFDCCIDLTSITIPNSVKSIGNDVFEGCTGLTSITIPNSVKSIGHGAFSGCTGLTSITIPNSVKSIEGSTFSYCTRLTSITIPNSVTLIGDGAFIGCTRLTSITIPNSVTYIGEFAFRNCTGLLSFTIPNSVTSIGRYTFAGCTCLTSITIPNSVTSIGYAVFEGCTDLTSITIPGSVKSIGNLAFHECRGLTSITISDGVNSIGDSAFQYCTSLTSVTFPKSVLLIGGAAFYGCSGLESITSLPEAPPFLYDLSFSNYNIPLYVPESAIETYQTTSPWNKFAEIRKLEGTIMEKCATPIISFGGKKLFFNCETDGVEYVYEIKDEDVKKGYANTVELTGTYEISVYATKSGYENSETANATLCWIDQQPKVEGDINGIANVLAKALLIKNNGGQLTVEGAADGEAISVYTVNGMQRGSAISQNGAAHIDTNLQTGSIAIVKIGNKSVKVVIK